MTKRASLLFVAVVIVQAFHSVEHVAQMIQRYLLGMGSHSHGVLGALDVEWVHLAFNAGLAVGLVALATLVPRRGLGWYSLLAAAVVQVGWHVPEHLVRMFQFLAYGWNPAPGILGHTAHAGTGPFDLLPLHFWYNAAVTLPLAVSFVAYRAYRLGPRRSEEAERSGQRGSVALRRSRLRPCISDSFISSRSSASSSAPP